MAGPVIEILSGDLAGRAYEIDADTFTIGRKDDCDIVLPKRYISRVHAELVREDDGFVVRGVSEKNPIVVEGKEVETHDLRDGDEFELAGIKFRFRAKGKATGASKNARRPSGEGPRNQHRFDSDEGEVDRVDPDEATDEPPPRERGGEKKRSGSGAADIDDGPLDDEASEQERVVFGDDDGGEAPEAKKSRAGSRDSQKGSTDEDAKGSNVGSRASGSGDDARGSDERTDAIDVTKLREKNKSDDPFADDGSDDKPKVDPVAAAARERFIKSLVIAGALGIVFAAAFLGRHYMTPTPPKQFVKEYTVALDETRRIDELWVREDPPENQKYTDLKGEPYLWFDDDVIRCEWAIPELPGKSMFLVTGKRAGESAFVMRFSRTGNSILFKITVQGPSQHEKFKAERKKRLAGMAISDQKAEANALLNRGRELKKGRDTPGKEDYYRRALNAFERADEAAKELSDAIDKGGIPDPDLGKLRDDIQAELKEAKSDHDKFVYRLKASYGAIVGRGERGREAAKALGLWLRAMGDTCDPEYMRMALIYELAYQGRVSQLRTECIERP